MTAIRPVVERTAGRGCIADFAKRTIVFRDGRIRRDTLNPTRPSAAEVLRTMPTLED